MNRIFINYRREDALLYADRLQEVLSEHFGPEEVFRDVDTIEMGLDFVDAIDRALSQANVMLVLIGRHWLVSPDGRTRLQEPEDYVRLEVAGGLERPNVRVIPVLVGGAVMPSADDLPSDLASLTRRHAFEMTDSRWRYDRDELVRRLSRVIEAGGLERPPNGRGGQATATHAPPPPPREEAASESPRPAAPPPPPAPPPAPLGVELEPSATSPPPTPRRRRWIAAAAAAFLVVAAIVVGALVLRGAGDDAISVPDVVGQTEEAARAALEEQGFEPSSTLVASEGEAGLVLSQEPAAGADASEGGPVALEVSQAPMDALLAMVPTAIRSGCLDEAPDGFPSGALAKVRCVTDEAVAVQYNLFADEAEMTETFEESLGNEEQALDRSIPDGSCESDRFAKGPYTVDDSDAGQVFCYVKDGSAWIEWMDTSLLVYSFALRDDGRSDLLYRWWVRSSGPVAPRP